MPEEISRIKARGFKTCIQNRITIQELLKRTTLGPIMSIIRSRTLKQLGHMKRSQIGLAKICLEGMVEVSRNRGRQKKRWPDNIHAWCGMNLQTMNEAYQNRDVWKRLTHVDAQSATSGDHHT